MYPAKKKLKFSLSWPSFVVVNASLFLSQAKAVDQDPDAVDLDPGGDLVDEDAPAAAGFRRMMMMSRFVTENLEPS